MKDIIPKEETPLVSIVLSTFDRPELVMTAIQSVLNQTFNSWELIIVDDNGIGTQAQKETFLKLKDLNYPNIKYHPLEKNMGCCGARNEGIKVSNGELIAFFDDDDVWMPDKLQKQVSSWQQNKDAGVIFSNMIVEDSYAKYEYITDFPEDYLNEKQLLKRGEGICTSALMVEKKILNKVGLFDESLESYTDYDMLLRLSQITSSAIVKKPLIIYKVLFRGISKNMKRKYQGKLSILEKYKHLYFTQKMFKEFAKHTQTLGDYSIMSGQTFLSLKFFANSIYYNPFDLKSYFKFLVAAFFGKNINIKIRRFFDSKYSLKD